MIDFGTEDPQVADMLERALEIIDVHIRECYQEFAGVREMPDDCELNRLVCELPRGCIDISGAVAVAVETAYGSLAQVHHLMRNPVPTTPVVLQVLLRAALVSSARTLYVLLPAEPETRLENARLVLGQDCDSGRRGLEDFSAFEGMQTFAAPRDLVSKIADQRTQLLPNGRPPGDGKIVEGMVSIVLNALELAGLDDEFGEAILHDHVSWLWNTYSGLAHGYFWPRLLPGLTSDRRIPGDFPLDLHQVATAAHMALLAVLDRTQAGSALTASPIPSSWPAT